MGKYIEIENYLTNQSEDEIKLSFKKIESIINDSLPKSAYKYRQWWSNDKTQVQANG